MSSNSFFSPSPTSGSFLPEDYIARKAELRANIIIMTLFAVVLAGVVGAFLVTSMEWSRLRAEKAEITEAIEAETKRVEQVKILEAQRAMMMEKAEITAALAERVPRWALLGEVLLRMPMDTRLELFHLKSRRVEQAPPPPPPQGGMVKSLTGSLTAETKAPERPRIMPPKFEYALVLSGSAERNNDIADYLAALRQSPVLTGVELQFIRESKEGDRVYRKFEINAALNDNVPPKVLADSLTALAERRQAKLRESVTVGSPSASAPQDADSEKGE